MMIKLENYNTDNNNHHILCSHNINESIFLLLNNNEDNETQKSIIEQIEGCNKCNQIFSKIKNDILKEFNHVYTREALNLLSKIIFKLDSEILLLKIKKEPNNSSIITNILEYPLILDYIDNSSKIIEDITDYYFKKEQKNEMYMYPGTFWLLLYNNPSLWNQIYPLVMKSKRNINNDDFHLYIPVLNKYWDCFSLSKNTNSIYLDPSEHNLWLSFLLLLEILPIGKVEINFISKQCKSFRPVILSLQKLKNEILRVDILCSLIKIFNYRWWFHSPFSYEAFKEKSLKRLLNSNKEENIIKACDISIIFFESIIDIVHEKEYKDIIYEIINIISNKLKENETKFIEILTQSIIIGKKKNNDFNIKIEPKWVLMIYNNIEKIDNYYFKDDLFKILRDLALDELISFKKEFKSMNIHSHSIHQFKNIWSIIFHEKTRKYFQDIIFVSYSRIGFILPEIINNNEGKTSYDHLSIIEWYFNYIKLIFSELSFDKLSGYERSLVLFNILITRGNNYNITIELLLKENSSLFEEKIIDYFINRDNITTFLKNIHEITSDILSIKHNYPKKYIIILLESINLILSKYKDDEPLIKLYENEFKLIIINTFILCKYYCQEDICFDDTNDKIININLIKNVCLLLKMLYSYFDHYKYIIDHLKNIKIWGSNLFKWKNNNDVCYYINEALDSIERSSDRNRYNISFKLNKSPIESSIIIEKKNDYNKSKTSSLFDSLLRERKLYNSDNDRTINDQNISSIYDEPIFNNNKSSSQSSYNVVDNSWRIQSLKKITQHNIISRQLQLQKPKQIVLSHPQSSKKSSFNNVSSGKKKENALMKEIKGSSSSKSIIKKQPVQPHQLITKKKDNNEEKIDFETRKKIELEKSREMLEQNIRKVTKPVEVVSIKKEGSCKEAFKKVLKDDMKKRKYISTIYDLHNKVLSINYYKLNIDECFGYQKLSTTITNTFKDENHYKEVFEPLLIEELKAQLEKSIQESDEKVYNVKVSSVGRINNTHSILFTCEELEYYENDVILISEKPVIESPDDIHVLGIVLRHDQNDFNNKGDNNDRRLYHFKVKVLLMDSNETRVNLFKEKLYGGTIWKVRRIYNLSTCTREWQSLQNCNSFPLFKTILNPVQSNIISKPYTLPEHLTSIFNRSQIRAIQASLKPGFTLIQGPPGTGKTTTIIGILSALLEEGLGPILLCAPSNCAVDEITLRIIKNGLYTVQKSTTRTLSTWKPTIIRAGIIDELTPKEVADVSLQKMIGSQAYNENIPIKHSNKISRAHIVSSTLSSSGLNIFRNINQEFKTVIIDESAQATELSVLIPLQYNCTRCIMVGDPQQLPATIISQKASNLNFEQSLFERFKKCKYPSIMLDVQYRMHPLIRKFPSEYFYDNRLKDGRKDNDKPWHKDKIFGPYIFFNVYGKTLSSKSLYNTSEALFIVNHLEKLINTYPNIDFKDKIGIITPYRSQVKEIKIQVKQSSILKRIYDHLEIHTIDSFQGKEKDIIIFSTVRSQGKKGIGFLSDIRRINVAITRAKYSLWIVGDSNALEVNECWSSLIKQAKEINVYIDI